MSYHNSAYDDYSQESQGEYQPARAGWKQTQNYPNGPQGTLSRFYWLDFQIAISHISRGSGIYEVGEGGIRYTKQNETKRHQNVKGFKKEKKYKYRITSFVLEQLFRERGARHSLVAKLAFPLLSGCDTTCIVILLASIHSFLTSIFWDLFIRYSHSHSHTCHDLTIANFVSPLINSSNLANDPILKSRFISASSSRCQFKQSYNSEFQ